MAEFWDVKNSDYHADRLRDSHSTLEVFQGSIPDYYDQFITQTVQHEPTEAMLMGTAMHYAVLEPDLFLQRVMKAPKCDRRTKEGKQIWEDFQSRLGPHTEVTLKEPEYNQVLAMRDAVQRHPFVRKYLETNDCKREQAVRFQCPETDLPLRCRLDLLAGDGTLLDLKKSDNPHPGNFMRKAANLGYHRQAALYSEARDQLGLRGQFYFIVVGDSRPYEVVVYRMVKQPLATGRLQNSVLLQELALCRSTNTWDSRYQEPVNFDLPVWDKI